jgi:hypothetical protein
MLRGNRPGGALLIALSGLLLLELIVAGTLAVGASERLLAHTRVRHVRTRLAAESAVRAAIDEWQAQGFDSLHTGQRVSFAPAPLPDSVRQVAEVERIADDLFLIRGRGIERNGRGDIIAEARAAAVITMIARASLWRDFAAAVTAAAGASFPDTAVLDGLQGTAQCPAVAPDMLSALGTTFVPALRTLSANPVQGTASLTGLPPVLLDSSLRVAPAVAGIAITDFQWLADRVTGGAVTPAPVSNGVSCDTTAAGNWGDPITPGSPCADWLPLIYSAGDLDYRSGAGQGVLVVNGDLRLGAGAVFHGAVIATGAIRVDHASIAGALRAADTTRVQLSGAVRYDACALDRAFRLSPGLQRPFRSLPRWWIPPH